MVKKSFIKINVRGGILSSGDLGSLVNILNEYKIEEIELGERQNIYFHIEKQKIKSIEEDLAKAALDFETDKNNFPNIISSYAAEDIFSTHPWFGEGIYRDILSSFSYRPQVKINISDNTQALVPLYTGDINFIPSTHLNFFHLFVNHRSLAGLKSWPRLVYVTDIPVLAKEIETAMHKKEISDLTALSDKINNQYKLITIDANEPLKVPRLRFPYYEGMNKFGDKFWLGIYRRNNDFSVSLLESIYNLCSQTRIGQVNITPWKSIMVKGIVEDERLEWEKLLSRHGINSRHSSLELNWQLADMDKEAIRIKNDLVKSFDEEDIRTYGISFAIYSGKKMDISSSVVIKKRPGIFNFWGFFKKMTMYDIMYSPDFSLNANSHRTYTSNITWNGLALNLKNLSQNYYKQLSAKAEIKENKTEEKVKAKEDQYQCLHCLTIYNEKYGEPVNGIIAGTKFELLADDYKCSLCESPKSDFIKMNTETFVS